MQSCPPPPQPFSWKKGILRHASDGIALVLVLTIIVLITGLVVAFFASVSTELVSAKSYSTGSSSKQLADATTQLVIGSIRKATSDTSTSPSGTDVVWASQPGMIRTWDNKGDARKCYKLFSSGSQEMDPPYDPTLTGDLDQNFDGKPAVFTDLNAPVTDAAGVLHYPIVDPTGAVSKDSGQEPLVAGFYITRPPAAATVPNAAPMPVRWLYVLQDGKIIAPTGGDKTATFTGAANVPTLQNPIVGRIAYWTDDETSKVNVNTASEGVYWDLPRLMSLEDTGRWSGTGSLPNVPGLALTQPASGEYQRFPGHPATTSLSPILGKLVPALKIPDPDTRLDAFNVGPFKTYYDLVPRIAQGGSVSGSVIPNPNPSNSGLASDPGSVKNDGDRLFASVDEFIFKQPVGSDTGRQTNGASLGKAVLEQTKFFLTAHSSAPEVTIFNTPRVSMWPVWKDSSLRTVLDSTLAFCADLNPNGTDMPYYFTRQNSRSMTDDYALSPRNQQLYAYLDRMMKTPVPGFGGSFSDATALGIDQPQVLTSIYDYIRCINLYDATTDANQKRATPYTQMIHMKQADTQGRWGGGEILPIRINGTQGFGRYATLSGIDLIFCAAQSTPPDTSSSPKVKLVQVMLLPTFFSPMQGLPGMYPKLKYTITADPNTFMLDGQPIFQDGGGIKGTNWITNAPVQQAEGRGMGGMISPRASLEQFGEFQTPFLKPFRHGASFAPSDPPTFSPNPTVAADGFASGAYPFVSFNKSDGTPNIVLGPPDPLFPNLPAPMKFVGGTLKIVVQAAEPSGPVIQTFNVLIPDDPAVPRPKLASGTGPGVQMFTNIFGSNRDGANPQQFIKDFDVVHGVEAAGPGDDPATTSGTNTSAGDIRMLAALPNVPANYYHAHKDWSGGREASGMLDDDGINKNFQIGSSRLYGPTSGWAGSHGALAKGMNPRGSVNTPRYGRRSPYVPSRTSTETLMGVTRTNNDASTPGDWDTGFALLPDGAYINMGDVGDQGYQDEVVNAYGDSRGPRYPYVEKEDHFNTDRGAGTYFSPNRQVPSSMVLGSIPTGVQRFQPWQTLLFNPKPEDPGHPGRGVRGQIPPDHLIADLFWMPVVSPYPISQPFSTAGKINLNYQIAPFNYIERSTGIYALMKATKMMAIPPSIYGSTDPKPFLGSVNELNSYPLLQQKFRFNINVKETLKGFEKTFASNDFFRAASQISEINLVPANGSATYEQMATYWLDNTMTGDNLREKPYVDLYPRLTTKSNSYTVHLRVQVLQKSPSTPVDQWVEGKDQIGSEYRGSSEIERYLDSSDRTLPDFAQKMAANPSDPDLNLDKYVRYRVVSAKRFSPY